MKKIILDTNFLLIPPQFKVDIFSEIDRICNFNYELSIIDKTVDELKKIIKTAKKGKDKAAAKLALALLKTRKIKKIKTKEGYVDNLILKSINKDCILATQDVLLRKEAVKKGAKVIFLRSKKYLILK